MVISFHPRLAGDVNLRFPRLPRDWLSPAQAACVRRARAVLLPQTVRRGQFVACAALCPNLFPNYRWRFGPEGQTYEGKFGAAALFERFGLPHPRTLRYASAAEFRARHLERAESLPAYPFVLKGDRGGGGNWVFLIEREADLARPLLCLDAVGWPLIVQEYVEHAGRDARVVVVGDYLFSYWRRQTAPGEFRNNVGRGAAIDHDSEPELLRAAEEAAQGLCRRTGLNLAAFDLLFGPDRRPLFCEINYNFGRKGLARAGDYYDLLARAAERWLARLRVGSGARVRPVVPLAAGAS